MIFNLEVVQTTLNILNDLQGKEKTYSQIEDTREKVKKLNDKANKWKNRIARFLKGAKASELLHE